MSAGMHAAIYARVSTLDEEPENQLAEIDALALARETRHELGRVGRAATDDGELHGPASSKEPKTEVTLCRRAARSQGRSGKPIG